MTLNCGLIYLDLSFFTLLPLSCQILSSVFLLRFPSLFFSHTDSRQVSNLYSWDMKCWEDREKVYASFLTPIQRQDRSRRIYFRYARQFQRLKSVNLTHYINKLQKKFIHFCQLLQKQHLTKSNTRKTGNRREFPQTDREHPHNITLNDEKLDIFPKKQEKSKDVPSQHRYSTSYQKVHLVHEGNKGIQTE